MSVDNVYFEKWQSSDVFRHGTGWQSSSYKSTLRQGFRLLYCPHNKLSTFLKMPTFHYKILLLRPKMMCKSGKGSLTRFKSVKPNGLNESLRHVWQTSNTLTEQLKYIEESINRTLKLSFLATVKKHFYFI